MGRILDAMFAGRSLREKINVAGGLTLGIVLPIVIFRYTGFMEGPGGFPESANIFQEANHWYIATLGGMGSMLSPIAGLVGYTAGVMDAGYLRRRKQGREQRGYWQRRDRLEEIPEGPRIPHQIPNFV